MFLGTDIGICSLKLFSVLNFNAATGRRFHCDIVLEKWVLIWIFSGLNESVRVTVWILSCSQVRWSKQICWVYGYKVVYDFVEVGLMSVCNISVIELVLWNMSQVYLVALCWTISSQCIWDFACGSKTQLLYSSFGLTSDVKAFSFTVFELTLRFLLIKFNFCVVSATNKSQKDFYEKHLYI